MGDAVGYIDLDDEDYWDDEDDDGRPWWAHETCANCGDWTTGDTCEQCGANLCPRCYECGAHFCRDCPTEGYNPYDQGC